MSEFYTKAQSDAQAAKIGAAIKTVKTPVAQLTTDVSKLKTDYSNLGSAANLDAGVADGKVPKAEQVFMAANTRVHAVINESTFSCNDLPEGTRSLVTSSAANVPPPLAGNSYWLIDYIKNNTAPGRGMQIAYGYTVAAIFIRGVFSGSWREWTPVTTNRLTYDTTTADAPNVVVNSFGVLQRSVSSERYKDILAPLELDDTAYDNAMQLAPIIYRSTANADNPNYHYYSFSAEELGAFDPAFTLWRETETVTGDDGNTTEQPLAERQAEGINLNAIVAFLHATNVKQDKLIKSLERKISALEEKPNQGSS